MRVVSARRGGSRWTDGRTDDGRGGGGRARRTGFLTTPLAARPARSSDFRVPRPTATDCICARATRTVFSRAVLSCEIDFCRERRGEERGGDRREKGQCGGVRGPRRAAALEGLAYVISYKAGDHVLQPARGWASSLASHSLVSNSPSPEIEARKRSNPSVELSQREMESEDRPERRRRKKGSS